MLCGTRSLATIEAGFR